MRVLKAIVLSVILVFSLCACSQPANEEQTAEAEVEADPVEEITSVLTKYSKWEIDDSTGIMVFNADGGGSFKSQLGDLDMNWEINDDLTIHTAFTYSGTQYGATYKLAEINGSYELQNVKDPSKAFKPIE